MKGRSGKYNEKWFYGCLIVLSCVFSVFYSKYVNYFDTPLHTVIAKSLLFEDADYDSNSILPHIYAYPAYHFVQKIVHCILKIDYEAAAVLVLSLSIIISIVLYRKLIFMIMEDTVINRYFADLVSVGMVVFAAARCRLNWWHYYHYSGVNPFHNPTILFVRPFAIASFMLFIQYIKNYGRQGYYKYAILFGFVTGVSVLAKPSYAVVFLPAMGIYTLYYMFCNKEIRFGIIAFIAVLPSLILLLLQQQWVLSKSQALNTIIQFGGSNQLSVKQVIMVSLVIFPTVFLLFHIRLMKEEPIFFISIFALGIGWFQNYCLYSGPAGDFAWGYFLAVQIATLVVLAETRNGEKFGKGRKIVNGVAYAIFGYQVIVGFRYLWLIYTTANYYI